MDTQKQKKQSPKEFDLVYCPSCRGSGEGMYDGSTCPDCFGQGEFLVEVEFDDEDGEEDE